MIRLEKAYDQTGESLGSDWRKRRVRLGKALGSDWGKLQASLRA